MVCVAVLSSECVLIHVSLWFLCGSLCDVVCFGCLCGLCVFVCVFACKCVFCVKYVV